MSPSQRGYGSRLKPHPYLHKVVILCKLLEFCVSQACQKSILPLLPPQVPVVIWTAEPWQENWAGNKSDCELCPEAQWMGPCIMEGETHALLLSPQAVFHATFPRAFRQKKTTTEFSWSLLYSPIGALYKENERRHFFLKLQYLLQVKHLPDVFFFS